MFLFVITTIVAVSESNLSVSYLKDNVFRKKMADKMALKSDDILSQIDPTIWLGDELEKLNLESQLDVESLLSLDTNKATETNISKDCAIYDLKTSLIKDEINTDELTPADSKVDINGNEETIPDENLNQLFLELELSDSDNEEKDEETSSKLRERGKEHRSTKSQNRTNFLGRNERYDRSQFSSRSLQFLSGSTIVQPSESAYQFSTVINQASVLNTSENISDPVSTPFSINFEDRRINSVGSPESGYESSLTGSPPRALLSASVSPNLDLIPENDDDLLFINYLVENDCALTGHDISRCDIDDRDRQGKISEIINFLKDTPYEPESCDSSTSSSLVLASPSNSRDCVPLISNSQDLNTNSFTLTPQLRNVEKPKLGYKLKDEAKHALRNFLSNDEYYVTQDRIYEEVRKRKDEEGKEDVRVIRVLDELDKSSDNRTSLHHAVLKSNIEEIFCLVEIHKQYGAPLSDVNIRDKYGKTALDYAVQNGNMTLVVDYLKENTACQSLNI